MKLGARDAMEKDNEMRRDDSDLHINTRVTNENLNTILTVDKEPNGLKYIQKVFINCIDSLNLETYLTCPTKD